MDDIDCILDNILRAETSSPRKKNRQPPPPPPPPPRPPPPQRPPRLKLRSLPSQSSSRPSGSSPCPDFGSFGPNTLPGELSHSKHSIPRHIREEYEPPMVPYFRRSFYSLTLHDPEPEKPEKPEEPDYYGRETAPLVQVFSVRFHPVFNDNNLCSIYGRIIVTEEDDAATTHTLYERQYSDSEVIAKKGFLSLIGPWLGESLSVISRSRGATMNLTLRDSVRDVDLIDAQLNFGSLIEEVDTVYDRVQCAVFEGQYGNVAVYYTTVLYGNMANIRVQFINDVDFGDHLPSDGHLVVTAHFGGCKLYRTEDVDSDSLEMLLVIRPLSDFVQQHGNVMLLSRHIVAVPAYSSLIVEASLHTSRGKSFCGFVEFSADPSGQYFHKFQLKNGHVRVDLTWDSVYPLLTKQRSAWGSPVPAVNVPNLRDTIIEVFSIRVCGINRDVHNVSGTVTIDDHDGDPFYIFEKDENNSEFLLPGDETLPLLGPQRISPDDYFMLRLNLKDPKKRLSLSTGHLEWTGAHTAWYDKRLCSVIRGKDGFAVVHHTAFEDGVRATIEAKVYFFARDDVAAVIYGSLVVRYGNYEYLTCYENKYFKTRLFSREKRDRLLLAKGANIPLTRSMLGAPKSSSLIIEVDLKATSGSKGFKFPEEEMRGELEFQVNLDTTNSQRIMGARGLYCVELFVKWDWD